MSTRKPKLMIIDGNALIHRSFHALPPTLTTRSGEMVNAVYGFTAVLVRALRELRPEYVVLTLDRAEPTFRHIEYKEYKATRVKAPDDLYSQIPWVKEIAKAFGVPIFEKAGFEADDLIGTIVNSTDGKIDKIILTGDLDTLQLVNSHTKAYTMHKGVSESIIYDEKMVKERYGLDPSQMIDYKALRGDPSDNIPGVRGIGEKTATELLKEFKTLDGVYLYIELNDKKLGIGKWEAEKNTKIKPRIIELLRNNKETAYLSKKLSIIKLDVDIDFDLEQAKFGQLDREKIIELFSELEFKSLLPRLKDIDIQPEQTLAEKHESGPTDKFGRNKNLFHYQLIDDDKKFDNFLAKLSARPDFTFDTEITDFDPLIGSLIGISFSWTKGEAYFVAITDHQPPTTDPREQQMNLFNPVSSIKSTEKIHHWLEKLQPIFENDKIKKYGHNIKFDVRVMRNHGIETNGVDFDTMIASYLLNPGSRQHNLDTVTFTELGFEKINKDDLLGKGKDKITFGEVPMERMMLYSCEDADFTNRLVDRLSNLLKENDLEKLFHEMEMPLVKVLAEIEDNGIKIDVPYLNKLSKKLNNDIKSLEKKIWKLADSEFNISSTQQLREILFDKLQISSKGIGKTKTGISTAADELFKMKDEHKIIPLIQDFRELRKLTTTYIDTLPKIVNKKTDRIHTSYNQAVTATGRLSSTEPNLQNIPIRREVGREIRKAFIAEKGHKLISLDYSQIELRLAAHMSGDKKMIDAFKRGVDIHSATAAEINQVSIDKVTKEMRREAKATNFGILYGQGPHGLSQTADIPYNRAKEFIRNYFEVYKGVKKYIDGSIDTAREKGYAETLFGRKRYLPEINSSVMQVMKNAERMAVNTPLQGTAADMLKVAMIQTNKFLHKINKDHPRVAKMLLTVHDELLFEITEDMVEKISKQLKEIMENVIKLKIPIVVDLSVGENWGELKKIATK